jgi:hypothetical protein
VFDRPSPILAMAQNRALGYLCCPSGNWLSELNGLGLPAAVLDHVLYRNAVGILGLG